MVPSEIRWRVKMGPFKENLIKELFTKMWAGYRESTREDTEPRADNRAVTLHAQPEEQEEGALHRPQEGESCGEGYPAVQGYRQLTATPKGRNQEDKYPDLVSSLLSDLWAVFPMG